MSTGDETKGKSSKLYDAKYEGQKGFNELNIGDSLVLYLARSVKGVEIEYTDGEITRLVFMLQDLFEGRKVMFEMVPDACYRKEG